MVVINGVTVNPEPLADVPNNVPPVDESYQFIVLPVDVADKSVELPQYIVSVVAVKFVGIAGGTTSTVTAVLVGLEHKVPDTQVIFNCPLPL